MNTPKIADSSRPATPSAQARDRAKGQSFAEFALVAPVLAILLLGLLQIGMILQTQIGVTNATREAARRASAAPTPTCAWVLDELKPASGTGLLAENVQTYEGSRSTVTIAFSRVDTSTTAFQTVNVQVAYDHPLIFPLIRELLDAIDGSADGSFTVSGDVEMRMEAPDASLQGNCTR